MRQNFSFVYTIPIDLVLFGFFYMSHDRRDWEMLDTANEIWENSFSIGFGFMLLARYNETTRFCGQPIQGGLFLRTDLAFGTDLSC